MFLMFLTFAAELNGQQLKVTVCSADENLPYANIFVNGRLLKISDSTGIAYIPQDILKYGDTISSSYLGFHPAQAVYDKEMQISRICTLKHVQTQTYETESVTISGSGKGWKAFQKYVKIESGAYLFHILFSGNFNAEILLPDITQRVVNGSFLFNNIPFNINMIKADPTLLIEFDSLNRRSKLVDRAKYYSGLPLQLSTMDDTTKLGNVLTYAIKNSFMVSCCTARILNQIQKEGSKNPNHKITYLGIKDGKRFFRLTYPCIFLNMEVEQESSIQYLIAVNATTKEIESASMSYFFAGENTPIPLMYTISFEKYKTPKFTTSIPVEIDVAAGIGTEFKLNLTLSNITAQFEK